MKKLYNILLLLSYLLLSISNLEAQHYKKDGTPDKRYKENKTSTYKSSYKSSSSTRKSYKTNTSSTVRRDRHGKIKRSSSAKRDFMKQSGYPKGRTGYVVDHIKPLKDGGCDCPSNMQWQTIEAGKAKDKWE